ncbi:MAG: UPF0280 family protein [Rhizobiaceae bacterium]|nr:UPF0280 family protein [Rhizobiaceae bacterium]
MSGPVASYLDGDAGGRLHLHHGPIDLVIGVDGAVSRELENYYRQHAYALAYRRFRTVLDELVAELPLLRSPAVPHGPEPRGDIARRMMAAVRPYGGDCFITPMAAVAGAVADTVLAAMLDGFAPDNRPRRIYVNNGGDIALHLDAGAEFRVGIAREDGADLGAFAIDADGPTRGIATSGRGGRSLSMGIADSVTALAGSAAEADAAATMIGNAVDLPDHPSVMRMPADQVKDDSDLGSRLVVTDCGALSHAEIGRALDAGCATGETLRSRGLVHRAALFLKDQGRVIIGARAWSRHAAIAGDETLCLNRSYARS